MSQDQRDVAVARASRTAYESPNAARESVRDLARMLGWGAANDASAFSALIPDGAKVVVKPNWVLHANRGSWGIDPLITHPYLIRAVVDELLATRAGEVTLGDAPIQECDFDALVRHGDLGEWGAATRARDARFRGPLDYRRTKSAEVDGIRVASEGLVSLDRFVLFDLGSESLLEPISDGKRFRVTVYPPEQMARTHAPGRHQYLVARDVMEADVVVNMPKLKTHKKAGVTCALKNLIGINGNKEYLPHHRLGGSEAGGDCYPGADKVKEALEFVFDRANSTQSHTARRAWYLGKRALERVLHDRGDQLGVEGAWSGNDTIWRTCLDLNRILLYGRADGTMATTPQRRVVQVVDAIVAGQGDGPLRPEPLELGLLLAGGNAASVDHVSARLLGYDPTRIPIAHHAFTRFRWPLTDFDASDVRVVGALGSGSADTLVRATGAVQHYPAGWRDAVATESVAR
ncbi:MAG: DUF362 domain-containing protein [Gemmatimonadaceae bacterium]